MMETEKKRKFIINIVYFFIIAALCFLVVKYGVSLLMPFILAFLLAWLLNRPIKFFSRKFNLNQKVTAILTVAAFYATIGSLITLLTIRLISGMQSLLRSLPGLYSSYVEPILIQIFTNIENSALEFDTSLISILNQMEIQIIQHVSQMVSNISFGAMTYVSEAAIALPALFIKLVLMVISTFFIAADFDKLTGFCIDQLSGRGRLLFIQTKEYIIGTLFVCIRSYLLIMSITFIELTIGLSLIEIEYSFFIALGISVFDILPVLGTGGIMIPWVVINGILGNYGLALRLLALYVIITIVRNILEPKIVGKQLGLHPVVTLSSMFAGVQLLGVIGLFGFPITLSLLKYLNDNGTIHIFRSKEEAEAERETEEKNQGEKNSQTEQKNDQT